MSIDPAIKKKLVNSIEVLSNKINSEVKADEALQFTQAVLNLSHAIHTLGEVDK